jgi:hypothetical protein
VAGKKGWRQGSTGKRGGGDDWSTRGQRRCEKRGVDELFGGALVGGGHTRAAAPRRWPGKKLGGR